MVGFLSAYLSDGNILHDLDIMLTEACANVVRHAYGDAEGSLEVRLSVEPGVFVDLEIVDWGSGFGQGARFENPGPESEGAGGFSSSPCSPTPWRSKPAAWKTSWPSISA